MSDVGSSAFGGSDAEPRAETEFAARAGGDSAPDVPVDDIESASIFGGSDAEPRAEPEFAARAGGDGAPDVPIDDIESASETADLLVNLEPRRATQPGRS